jgi:membrane protein YqaA with SNARE-associated domain
MFGWAFAEATVWPIIPDALLVPMAAGNRRRSHVPLLAAVQGMALGGTALYLFAFVAPRRASRLLVRLPTVHERAIAGAQSRLNARGVWAFFWQPWSGIPFKVWAVVAGGQRLKPQRAIPIFVVARGMRMALLTTLARFLADRFIGVVRDRSLLLAVLYLALFFAGWWRLVRPDRGAGAPGSLG